LVANITVRHVDECVFKDSEDDAVAADVFVVGDLPKQSKESLAKGDMGIGGGK
jgi:hypothetical protein